MREVSTRNETCQKVVGASNYILHHSESTVNADDIEKAAETARDIIEYVTGGGVIE